MKKNVLNLTILIAFLALLISSCSKVDDIQQPAENSEVGLKATYVWTNVLWDTFSGTSVSTSNWSIANGWADPNSSYCNYKTSMVTTGTMDGLSCMVITAWKYATNNYYSGRVTSVKTCTPGWNQEYHIYGKVKLVTYVSGVVSNFNTSYGAWPAFWTTASTSWPTKGEVDIMEGYSKGGSDYYACNLHYGTVANTDLVTTCETSYTLTQGWHTYDVYWKNTAGTCQIIIKIDGATKKTYTDSSDSNGKLKLANFSANNLIINMCVDYTKGGTWDPFPGTTNLYDKVQMWVDYAGIEYRNL
jgi:hypothetical protein